MRRRSLRALTVLFVDDDPDTAEMYAEWFELRGAISLIATSARAARTLLAAIVVDVVVTDVAMPGETGIELARWMKAHRATASVPIVALTGIPHERLPPD